MLLLSKFLTTGELNLDAICGNSSTTEYMNILLGVLEIIGQSKECLQAYPKSVSLMLSSS